VLEALLFAAGDPVSLTRLCVASGESREVVESALKDLAGEYRRLGRGVRLVKLEEDYQMTSSPEYAGQIRDMMDSRKPDRLSQPALEVLSVVAYYQPVTRAYIEQVRGVDSAYTLNLLTDRELVEECGRLDMPGRPILYRTTQAFLRAFGLSDLAQLPPLATIDN
jgi:segregation and condensation protein B